MNRPTVLESRSTSTRYEGAILSPYVLPEPTARLWHRNTIAGNCQRPIFRTRYNLKHKKNKVVLPHRDTTLFLFMGFSKMYFVLILLDEFFLLIMKNFMYVCGLEQKI